MLTDRQLNRFFRRVEDSSGCWLTTFHKNHHGYSTVSVRDKDTGERFWLAHRLMYAHFVGDVPAGHQLDHLCRNRACVNPTHLEVVTCVENVRRGILGVLRTEEYSRRRAEIQRGKRWRMSDAARERHRAAHRARSERQTHCKRGHAFDEVNTYRDKHGARSCLTCRREASLRWHRSSVQNKAA